MEDLYNPEELISCPYNSSHRIRRCKMSFHLVKCKVNYGEQQMVPCDFNTTHMIPEPELQYHHQICPDRKKVEARIIKEPTQTKTLNKFPLPQNQVEAEENWDLCDVPSYDPKKYCEKNDVIRHLDVASGSKKRNFRLEERLRLSELSRQSNEASGSQRPNNENNGLSFPPHPPRVNAVEDDEDDCNRTHLREKLKKGANKIFLRFDQH